MADAGLTVVGFDELVAGSRRLFAKIGDEANSRFGRVAQRKADEAKARIPRRSGRMAASVQARLDPERASAGISKADVPYAGFVEFGGTRNRPYYPRGRYLFPILLAAAPELEDQARAAATDEIRGFSWPRPRTSLS